MSDFNHIEGHALTPPMTQSSAVQAARSPITVAAGFLGAFVVASLAVQLVRTATPVPAGASAEVAPVSAHQAALWQPLAQR